MSELPDETPVPQGAPSPYEGDVPPTQDDEASE
jgi:hypothetical protein